MMDHPAISYYNFDLSQHHIDKSNTYSCSICSNAYNYEHSLRRHVLRTHINRAYISSKDIAIFDILVDGHHQIQPSSTKMYSCNVCQTLYEDSKELSVHFKNSHSASVLSSNAERIVIQCPDCDAKFNSMRSLNCHRRYHRNGWTANGRSSVSPALQTAASTAHNPSIPSANAINNTSPLTSTSSRHRATPSLSTQAKDETSSPSSRKLKSASSPNTKNNSKAASHQSTKARGKEKSVAPLTASGVGNVHRTKGKEKNSTHSNSTLASMEVTGKDAQSLAKGRQLRQRTSMQKQASLFTCTVCRKTFHSYGNMMRHRRLGHETVIKRRPEIIHTKRKTTKPSKFCDPKVAKKYYNKVAGDIAFNIKNCIHGNSNHIELSNNCIRAESKTNLRELKVNTLSKKMIRQCNIKTKPASTISVSARKLAGSSSTNSLSQADEQENSTSSQEDKSPDVYDKPGLWKLLCLVCLQYFPNTLELFEHQDTIHKRINVGHMEVGKSYELPLHSVATSRPVGCIPVSSGHDIVCTPSRYTCTKCFKQFKNSAELHPHLTICGIDPLKPLEIKIPDSTYTEHLADQTYGKVKGKKSHWQRGDSQRKLTDMQGFNVRKRKRLVIEVKEQERLEKLRATNNLSPDSYHSATELSHPMAEVKESNSESQSNSEKQPSSERVYKFKYSCPYCSITFKYRKVYERHVENKCEMLKRIPSPDKSHEDVNEQSDKEEPHVVTDETEADKIPKVELVDDLFTPQKSLAQARVLARFIHPARTCGPCFTCKKPNMARRYSHLQQRSDNFVQFVMKKCKNISLQSCICKACELNYKRDYDKRKLRLERYAARKKTPPKTQPNKTISNDENEDECKGFTKQKPSTTRKTISKQIHTGKSASKKVRTLPNDSSLDGKYKRGTNKFNRSKDKPAMSSVSKRKLYKPVQTKSLEQIFPENGEEYGDTSSGNQGTSSAAQSPCKITTRSNGGDFFLPVDQDIIDVEREMIGERLMDKGGGMPKQQIPQNPTLVIGDNVVDSKVAALLNVKSLMACTSLMSCTNTLITAPRPLRKSEIEAMAPVADGDSITALDRAKEQAKNDARLKVILQFVNETSNSKKFTAGKKLSLTEIIDAVTDKVKEDPRLATTLTEAIESASAKGRSFRNQLKFPFSDSGNAFESKSLPSVLDGLVTKIDCKASGLVFNTLPHSSMTKAQSSPTRPAHTVAYLLSTSVQNQQETDTPSVSSTIVMASSASNNDQGVDSISSASRPTSTYTSIPSDSICTASANSNQKHVAVDTPPLCAAASQSSNISTTDNHSESLGSIDELVPCKAGQFFVPKARKRRSSGSVSSSSHTSGSTQIRKKFIMTESSFKHMVEIIDAVACGDINPSSSPCFDDDSRSVSSSDATGSQGSRYSYDFMVDFRDNYDYIRTAAHAGPNPQPNKNLRLASIIHKLSSSGRDESKLSPSSREENKNSASVTSPTISQNPKSIDSGFTSLAE